MAVTSRPPSKGRSIQWPRSRKGWFTDELNADRDPTLDALIDLEAEGGPAPYGYRVERPSHGLTPLTHNPYFNVSLGLVQIGLGAFLLEKSGLALWDGSVPVCSAFSESSSLRSRSAESPPDTARDEPLVSTSPLTGEKCRPSCGGTRRPLG